MNGQVTSSEKVLEWELKRLVATSKRLRKLQGVTLNPNLDNWVNERKLEEIRGEILKVKMELGLDNMRDLLTKKYQLGNAMSILATKISRGNRKFSTTEIYVPNSNLAPEEVLNRIVTIMMENNPTHLAMNLNSNPDHYVLQSMSKDSQEVVEYTGGSPLPTRFFAHYGDEEGLKSKLSAGYSTQAQGTARLEDGTVIGGVRHQVKKEGNGFRFKALVEFPSVLPNFMIRAHQLHLACEFGHWISNALEDENF